MIMEKKVKQIGKLYKARMLEELTTKLDNSHGLLVMNFAYLAMDKQRDLRAKVKKADAKLIVVKNSLTKRALVKLDKQKLADGLSGTTVIAIAHGDPIQMCKAVATFMKDNQGLTIRTSWIDGELMDSASVRELASLPSKEVLIARTVSGIKAPINNLVYVLNNLMTKLVIVLNNIEQKKQG